MLFYFSWKNDNNNNETSTMGAHTRPFFEKFPFICCRCRCQTEIDAHELDSYPAFVGNNNACNIYTPAYVNKPTPISHERPFVIIFPEAAADKRGLIDSNRFVNRAFRRAGIVCCGGGIIVVVDRPQRRRKPYVIAQMSCQIN